MELKKAIKEVLKFLFENYKNSGGTSLSDIAEVLTGSGITPQEMGKYLMDHGMVKNQRFVPTGGFQCSITMPGISEVAADYLVERENKIISTLGLLGDWQSILEVLSLEPGDFQIAFDLAAYFKNRGIIEVQNHATDIFIKLTLQGRDYYNRNKATFTPQ